MFLFNLLFGTKVRVVIWASVLAAGFFLNKYGWQSQAVTDVCTCINIWFFVMLLWEVPEYYREKKRNQLILDEKKEQEDARLHPGIVVKYPEADAPANAQWQTAIGFVYRAEDLEQGIHKVAAYFRKDGSYGLGGGKREAKDRSSLENLLRELREEFGITPDMIQVAVCHGMVSDSGYLNVYWTVILKKDVQDKYVEAEQVPTWLPVQQYLQQSAFAAIDALMFARSIKGINEHYLAKRPTRLQLLKLLWSM